MRTFHAEPFEKTINKVLSHEQRRQLTTFEQGLKHGEQRGKPLGPHCLREYKLQGKRVYYVVAYGGALFVAASDKKQQQRTIQQVREELPRIKNALRRLMSR